MAARQATDPNEPNKSAAAADQGNAEEEVKDGEEADE